MALNDERLLGNDLSFGACLTVVPTQEHLGQMFYKRTNVLQTGEAA
jgi:hypothetical protein